MASAHSRFWRAGGLFALLCVAACAGGVDGAQVQSGPVCVYADLAFDAAFETGRLSRCERVGPNAFQLTISPENTPINPSPWYAFAIESPTARALSLTLAYSESRHRYEPDVSVDGGFTWREVAADASDDGAQAAIVLEIPAGRTLVSASPPIFAARYRGWLEAITARMGAALETIGASEQGRPLWAAHIGAPDAPVFVVLGGQHPPEVSGGEALFAFVDRMLEDDPLAMRFRDTYALAIAPLLNPDGLYAGNWRHNARGVDLNRDWGPFTQTETRAVRDWLSDFDAPAAMYDFHSTWRDVLYTPEDGAEGARSWLPGAFHDALVARLGPDAPDRSASHQTGRPTSRTWFHETYRAPAITYEVGDDTPLRQTQRVARAAAEETMRLLLSDPESHPREVDPP